MCSQAIDQNILPKVHIKITDSLSDLNCLIHKYDKWQNREQYIFTCTVRHLLCSQMFYGILGVFRVLTFKNCLQILITNVSKPRHCCCRLQHKSLNRLCAFTRCNPVWIRLDLGLVINIHEIVLTNHSKGQR
jgi:hypothetical protein